MPTDPIDSALDSASGAKGIRAAFAARSRKGQKVLIIYLMAGHPHPDFTAAIVPQLSEAGADIVELGFPFSDPIADGPVIQAAAQEALAMLPALPPCLELAARIRANSAIPLVSMTYYNPIFRYGEARFFADGLAAGLNGVIVPDLPLQEGGAFAAEGRTRGMATIFLEAPNTDDAGAKAIAAASSGFVYLVSLKGVTGSEQGLGENLQARAERIRRLTDTPTAVGFGINTPAQAGAMGRFCDGIIVGSGVVSRINEKTKTFTQTEREVLTYVRELRDGLDQGG